MKNCFKDWSQSILDGEKVAVVIQKFVLTLMLTVSLLKQKCVSMKLNQVFNQIPGRDKYAVRAYYECAWAW